MKDPEKRSPNKVLSVPSSMEYVQKYGEYLDRNWAEQNDSYKQIVACGIVRHGHKLFCVRRSRRSNRDALRLRWTLMFGGHVDEFDEGAVQPIRNCLVRELDEELGITPKTEPKIIGFIVDPETEVGRLHLGIVFDVEIDSDEINLMAKYDRDEFVHSNRTYTVKTMGFAEISRIRDGFDPWSTIFLSSPFASQLFGFERQVYSQLPLDLRW